MAKPRPDVEKRLLCDLTEEELLLKGAEQSALVLEIERLAKEKADFCSVNKAATDKANSRVAELAREVDQKRALKPVRCTWEMGDKDWLLYRNDTNKVIDREPLTMADRQGELLS